MKVTKELTDKTMIVKVEGWLDIQSNKEFAAFMSEIPVQEKLVMDFQNLEYISSSGIREIVSVVLRQPEGTFSIINVSPSIKSVFEMIGLDKKISIS
ncbi:MAG: STAS domain-containing protein [Lachnospiraceae bacterium]|nr:STAS domain-containing protein [Lachnospiraceae bacterium]